MSDPVGDNYQYWRDHGGEWASEYAKRKTWMVLYHIQELMLTEYVLQHAKALHRPLRVLEFGCGVGRHLYNLSRLPDVDVHGYDQSASMASGMLAWADADWFAEHVKVGAPTGRLPYEDGEFDLVYSAEVLVHVRPEDLPATLGELVRLCRGHVFHLETSPDYPVYGNVHSGCWKHDLPAAYRGLGLECETLERGYQAHTPYRVTIGEPPVFRWEPAVLDLYRRMEKHIDRGFDVGDAALKQEHAVAVGNAAKLAETEAAKLATEGALGAAAARVTELESHAVVLETRLAELSTMTESLRGELVARTAAAEKLAEQLRETQATLDETGARLGAEIERARALLAETRRLAAVDQLASEARASSWRDRALALEARLGTTSAKLADTVTAQTEFIRGLRAAIEI